MPPTTAAQFDSVYRSAITPWGDFRVPPEVKALAEGHRTVLELGCGVGRFSRWLARQGLDVTAVDFSTTAIEKAKRASEGDDRHARYSVADVTQLALDREGFDASFDVGCFHCLAGEGQQRYVEGLARVLAPGAVHVLWALDRSPSGLTFEPSAVAAWFAPQFTLLKSESSRRRLVASHWYWLLRAG